MTYLLTVDAKLKDLINEEIENWEDGQSCTFKFSFSEVGLVHEPSESDLEILVSDLPYIEALELEEDETLLVTVDKYTLKAAHEAQLQEWIEESDLKQFGRYESCGWI
ncbi:hypothetical protein GMB34_11850 [Turicibacter sanguinis]|jgi:hypothetical protein|nr:hypothetical protein [Turicibacter sanguinis]DAN56608.1 MAG TPA: hypothetical protein [Caudoviricetes sp.]MTN84887.1 hypothetical protein [Turicibacter sanguinis]MTN87709.1 hypothetical protein [Turicibacter sanguinis]MTN90531.1 hypothetical protein [Turicibacter sanguinis]